jgi:hypothetical protein
MKLGKTAFGSGQAMLTLIGMSAAIPLCISLLIAADSAIAVIVTVLRRQLVPRDMLLLPAGFLVGVVGTSAIDSETRFWVAVAFLLPAAYLIMTLTLGVRYQLSRRRSAES